MSKPKILLITNLLDNTGYGKLGRMILDDFKRFADVKVLYLRRGGPQISNKNDYTDCLTKDIKGFNGYLTLIDAMGYYPDKKISYFLTYEFDQLSHAFLQKIRPDTTNLVLSFTEHVANLVEKQTRVKSLRYLPQFTVPNVFPKPPNGPYVFYHITSNLGNRKHSLENLLSYMWAFTNKDNVQFLCKVAGGCKEKFEKALTETISHSSLGLRTNLPPIQFEERDLTDNQILNLHASCDCFISVSYGEGMSLAAYEASKLNKPIIYNNIPPYVEYLKPYFPNGLVESTPDIGLHVCEVPTFNFGFDCIESSTPLIKISEKMRELYEKNVRWIEPFDWSKTDSTESIINEICEATKKG